MDKNVEETVTAGETYLGSDEGTNVSSSSSSYIDRIISQLGAGIRPIGLPTFVKFHTESLTPFFKRVHNSLIHILYPDGEYYEAGLITEAYISEDISTLRIGFEVPKCIADLVNGIGTIQVHQGAYTIVPQPDDIPKESKDKWWNLISSDIIDKFSALVHAVKYRGFIRTAFLKKNCEGTAWWMISARSAGNIANFDTDNVSICATFKEYTAIDGLMCAATRRGNDGFDSYSSTLKWRMSSRISAVGLTHNFILDA